MATKFNTVIEQSSKKVEALELGSWYVGKNTRRLYLCGDYSPSGMYTGMEFADGMIPRQVILPGVHHLEPVSAVDIKFEV